MQIFTSDLDRTLIFSERTIAKAQHERICIEVLNEREISYVTEEIERLLQQVNEQMHFVPVTTRSREQYERITLFQESIVPEIVIVANGGIILKNGEMDQMWEREIEQMMDTLPLSLEQLPHHFSQQLSADCFLQHQVMDNLFFVYNIDFDLIDLSKMEQFQIQLNMCGWASYLHGRKFYIVPKELTKGAAVRYLKEQHNYDMHFAAGDSLMDMSMLYLANRSFAPLHGEIIHYPEQSREIEMIQKSGAAFAEYCLQQILSQ